MQESVVHIKIPSSVQDDFSSKNILLHLIAKALAKKEYYRSQESFFAAKHGLTFSRFEAKVKKMKKENFECWDDLMEWEACHLAGQEWNKKHKDLLRCWKSSKK